MYLFSHCTQHIASGALIDAYPHSLNFKAIMPLPLVFVLCGKIKKAAAYETLRLPVNSSAGCHDGGSSSP